MGESNGTAVIEPSALARLLEREVPRRTVDVPMADGTTITFVFQSLGRALYDALVNEHPPVDDDTSRWIWDPETFPAALISACLVEPKLTVDEVTQLRRSPAWTSAEFDALFTAAHAVNTENRLTSLGKGSGTTRA